MGPVGRGRPIRNAILAVLAVIAVLGATACTSSDQPGVDAQAQAQAQAVPDDGPWWCDSTGGGHGDHVMSPDPYAGVVKGVLSPEDCAQDSTWFTWARDYAGQWPTAAEAELDGWHRVVPYAAGMGTHYVRGSLRDLDGAFDGGEPEFLMYDGDSPDARLTGMAWFVRSEGGPPAGFAGDNDWWHQHLDMCLSADETWLGQGVSEDDCAARDGIHEPGVDWWMAHAWILPEWEIRSDVFTNHHPCLPAEGPIASRSDPCWEKAVHGTTYDDTMDHAG